jgi:hypothetical protein
LLSDFCGYHSEVQQSDGLDSNKRKRRKKEKKKEKASPNALANLSIVWSLSQVPTLIYIHEVITRQENPALSIPVFLKIS